MSSLSSRGFAGLLLLLLFVPAGYSKDPANAPSSDSNPPVESALGESTAPAPAANASAATSEAAAQDNKKIENDDVGPAPRFAPMLATTGTIGYFNLETGETLPKGGFL